MQVVHLSQTQDREAWLELRRGKISGTKAKEVRPLSRGADRTPQGFWKLLAEKIAIEPDGENVIDRGKRLENEGLIKTAKQFDLSLDLDPGLWVSSIHEDIAVSPDACEYGADQPTYAAENKSLSSDNHLKYVIRDIKARKFADTYKAIDQVPEDYHYQCIQYFVVNDSLKTLYFTLYDDRIAIEKYVHHVIVINREDIEEEIEAQKTIELQTLDDLEALMKEMGIIE